MTMMCGGFEIFEWAHHFQIEFELGRPIRIESRSFAGLYCITTHDITILSV